MTLKRAAFLCALVLGPRPAHAFAKVEKDDANLEVTGNVRLFGGFLHYPEFPPFPADDGLAAGVGRLILKGDFSKDVSYEFHGYFDLERGLSSGSGLGGTFATAGSFQTPYRTQYLAWNFWNYGTDRGYIGVDRMSVHARAGKFDFTVGRFPINDSVTHILTPNDFFAPFSATAINKVYKPGVDAVRVGVSLGRLSGIELTGVLGNDLNGVPAWAQSAVFLRAHTVLAGFDFALTGGKLAERWMAGGSFQGSIGPVDLRGEGHVGFADRNGDGTLGDLNANNQAPDKIHGRVAGGIGWRSVWHNFFVDAEYAYYSDGTSTPSNYVLRVQKLFPDDLPFLGQHYAGLAAGLDLIPILHASVLGLVNCGDGSGMGVVSLAYDISDESAFYGGILLPWGGRPQANLLGLPLLQSEFGNYPLAIFLETRFYF